MQWAGHVQRMEGTRAPKRLMELWRGVEAEDDLGVGGVMELRGICGLWEFGAGKKQLLNASNGEICSTKPRPTQGCRALMMMNFIT
ncbi:jg21239 [Pararge aegeria aegeria]|uniref:Jg21239 protein n=1 Tax=Pararge aegeria aegeria TaxID=348720 RepID=A0A8S4QMJ7_9NEOP|nr:jg21239 [Pararge aegeria aegeria]